MAYTVEIISMERKEELVDRYSSGIPYEIKSEIYGCCIKLLTGVTSVKAAWEESFYSRVPEHSFPRTSLCAAG